MTYAFVMIGISKRLKTLYDFFQPGYASYKYSIYTEKKRRSDVQVRSGRTSPVHVSEQRLGGSSGLRVRQAGRVRRRKTKTDPDGGGTKTVREHRMLSHTGDTAAPSYITHFPFLCTLVHFPFINL